MMGRATSVRVLAAAVLAGLLWVGLAVRAGEKKTSPAAKSGKVAGILTERKDTYVMVKPEGKQESEKFLLAPPGGTASPDVQAAVKTLFIPNLVALKWQTQGGDPVVTEISALIPTPKRSVQVSGNKTVVSYSLAGTLLGTVVAREVGEKTSTCYVDVKPDGRQDFIACDGPASLFEKAMKKGVLDLRGFMIMKQDFTECYWPAFVIDKATNKGGFDPKVIETMGTLNPGDKVRIDWRYDERKRAAKLQVLSHASAPKTTEKEKTAKREKE